MSSWLFWIKCWKEQCILFTVASQHYWGLWRWKSGALWHGGNCPPSPFAKFLAVGKLLENFPDIKYLSRNAQFAAKNPFLWKLKFLAPILSVGNLHLSVGIMSQKLQLSGVLTFLIHNATSGTWQLCCQHLGIKEYLFHRQLLCLWIVLHNQKQCHRTVPICMPTGIVNCVALWKNRCISTYQCSPQIMNFLVTNPGMAKTDPGIAIPNCNKKWIQQ